jgi:hypothetical protein
MFLAKKIKMLNKQKVKEYLKDGLIFTQMKIN